MPLLLDHHGLLGVGVVGCSDAFAKHGMSLLDGELIDGGVGEDLNVLEVSRTIRASDRTRHSTSLSPAHSRATVIKGIPG